jgi:hypothetical protein
MGVENLEILITFILNANYNKLISARECGMFNYLG